MSNKQRLIDGYRQALSILEVLDFSEVDGAYDLMPWALLEFVKEKLDEAEDPSGLRPAKVLISIVRLQCPHCRAPHTTPQSDIHIAYDTVKSISEQPQGISCPSCETVYRVPYFNEAINQPSPSPTSP